MKKWIWILCICLCKCAMDYSVASGIANKSGDTIVVDIQFSSLFFDSVFHGDKQRILLSIQQINKQTRLPFVFDSLSLSTRYQLPSDTILLVDYTKGGRGVVPDHETIKKITITNKGSIKVYEQKELGTLFSKKDNGFWEMEIR